MIHGVRYLTSNTSQLYGASALTATNVVASSAFGAARDAEGGGSVALTGSYTGAADAAYEVEITSTSIPGDPQLSAPAFVGVGNGVLSGLSATGIAAQRFTVTVADLGTVTRSAWAILGPGTVQARVSGPGANTYTLHVDQSGITATATDYAVQRALSEGVDTYTSEHYNFGGPLLDPDGMVPNDAPRIRFGDAIEVYRHWRERRPGGGYQYRFSPAPPRDVPVGTRVYMITGDREVTLYDGASLLETYTSVTTLYSLLTQIQAGTEIEYVGAIANDRLPGGMGSDDLDVFTASYVAGSTREGTRFVQQAEITLTVDTAAPSERLTVTCIGAPIVGAEIWEVRGDISGRLDDAITGVAYDDDGYAFTIPVQLQPGTIPDGDKAAYLELLTRSAQEVEPVLCVQNFVLGAEARQMTYEFVWTARPADDCDCSGVTVSGYLDPALLGIDPPEGGATMAESIPAALQSRVETVTAWLLGFLRSNTAFMSTAGDQLMQVAINENADDGGFYWSFATGFLQQTSAIFKADRADGRLAKAVHDLFVKHLAKIYAGKGNTLPEAAATEFDGQWTSFVAFLSPLETNVGSDNWATNVFNAYSEFIHSSTATAKSDLAEAAGQALAKQLAESRNITSDPTPAIDLAKAAIGQIYVKAGLFSPFEAATLTGNSVWSDGGGSHWFVSRNGLLPLQPGRAYYSCKLAEDEAGELVPTATKEFFIALGIGCESNLKPGDVLKIVTGPYANARATYQEGDRISYEIIRAEPIALSGGQTGDDTITFSVRGSVVGALADYALDTTAPVPYSDGGLEFAITPGTIPFAAGDYWTFSAEGGVFRWRKNAGSWTTGVAIADAVALSDGVSAVFSTGASPSWVVGDTYTLTAYAINGVANLVTPDDAALSWTSSTVINWTPTSGTLATLMIAAHTIPAGAMITLSASDDNWSTTAYSATLTHSTGPIVHLIEPRTHAKWRLTISGGSGSIGWLYAGEGTQPLLPSGIPDGGEWRQSVRLADTRRGRAISGTYAHEGITRASAESLLSALEHATQTDDGRIGVVSPAGFGAFCRIDTDEIPFTDQHWFQASAPLLFFSIPLQAA